MAEKSKIAEKFILFLFFLVFAAIVIFFAYRWDYLGDSADVSQDVASFQYQTASKISLTSSAEESDVSHSESSDVSYAESSDVSYVESSSMATVSDKININTASAAELDSLPGIGQKKAESIIAYRENNGPFRTIEDLKNVSGIGDKVFEDLKDYICVE